MKKEGEREEWKGYIAPMSPLCIYVCINAKDDSIRNASANFVWEEISSIKIRELLLSKHNYLLNYHCILKNRAIKDIER